jgi:dTDP-4-dehydrorhamnose reductase
MGPINVTQRVAILGSSGQLGTDLVDVLRGDEQFEVVALTHQDADCTKVDEVRGVVSDIRPGAVINCAAYVRVDECEDHADEAFRVNAVGALNIAKACAEVDSLCVYISTDYVFDGEKETAYVESDTPNPINVYGTSKLAGEYLTRQAAPRWLIVRVSSLFGKTGARGKGGNFIETILDKAKKGEALRVVDDIRISPTYTRDAAEAVRQLLKTEVQGIIHAANFGSCTWHEFAKTALELCGLPSEVEAIDSLAYPTRAKRPMNSMLASCRFKNHKVSPWQSALKFYLAERGYLLANA